ncbi:hypothetical protein [Maricaulis sp. MIT060901]|uniref:hypothetical protein n=1 Tax=Maricaulis sp. MIT060901 TaxID=3096993 RepID=UPI00399BD2C8
MTGLPLRYTPRLISLVALLAIPVFFYAKSFDAFRPFGSLPLLAVLGLCVAGTVLMRRVFVNWIYVVLVGYSLFILALSLMGLMPEAWTRYFETEAALRHWLAIPSLALATTVFVGLFTRYRDFIVKRALALTIFFYLYEQAMLFLTDEDFYWLMYDVKNQSMATMMTLIIFLFRERRAIWIDLALIMIYLLMAASSSHQILALALLALRLAPRENWVVIGVGSVIGLMLILAPIYASDLWEIDRNAAVRAIMWRDAVDAMVQSNGLGVGFGTEYIRNQFYALGVGDWRVVSEGGDSRLYLSSHSAIYDMAVRLGLPGILLATAWISSIALAPRGLSAIGRKTYAAMSCCFIVFAAFNPVLNSFNIIFGGAMMLAWMQVIALEARSARSAEPATSTNSLPVQAAG